MAQTGEINVTIYGGNRQLWSGPSVSLELNDPFSDTKKTLVRYDMEAGTATVLMTKVPADKGQRYILRATTAGYRDAGIFPVIPIPGGVRHTAVMLIPNKPEPDFSQLSFQKLQDYSPAFHHALAEEGKISEADFLGLEPARIMAALNVEAKLRNAKLAEGTAVQFLRKIDNLESLHPDRIIAWVAKGMPQSVAQAEAFTKVPDWINKPGHKEHPIGYKEQVPFGSLQLSFAEFPMGNLLNADIDIDLFSGLPHFGEWLKNKFSKQKTDQFTVFVQLFDQRVFPMYILKP